MSVTSSASERRRFTRVPFDTQAQVTHLGSGQTIKVVLLDLCLQGALVELPAEFFMKEGPNVVFSVCGEKIKLELFLDECSTTISMETEVAHVAGRNLGLRCRALDLDSITHLRRLVELNLGDAELFHREIVLLGHPFPSILSENQR
jgi:hypothetical protein